jgi:maltose O-acetyltransferase
MVNILILRVLSRIIFLIQKPRIWKYMIISNLKIRGKPRRKQPLQAIGRGVLIVGNEVTFGAFPSPGFLSTYSYIEARGVNSSIEIGDGTAINNGFVAIAEHTQIKIGDKCLIGANCEIIDSDFHGLKVDDRSFSRVEWSRPVSIENNVFLGSNVKIMKGVTIGEGAVIANSSVVTKDIPPQSIAGGNPARVIKVLPQS